uniref:Uncharacterized protein n=1 Tax=Octopus bimaculoides TaxID=37653 RepID=A0A0L8FQV9_OCTBM
MLTDTNRIKYAGTGYEDEVEPDKRDHMIMKYKYLAFKMVMISIYVSLILGTAVFLMAYIFLWHPIRGNYSSHHIYIDHQKPLYHSE